MISHSRTWKQSAGLLAAVSVLTGAPASAQYGGDEAVFVDLGRWTIFERPRSRSCELRLNSNSSDGLVFSKTDRRPGSLRLNGSNRRGYAQGPVYWEFDDTQFDGQMLSGGLYAPVTDSSAIEQKFRQARTLTVRQGGQVVAQMSLKTSSAGFRLLNQCAEQWRYRAAPIQPEPQRPAPSIARRSVAPPPPTSAPQARTQRAAATLPSRPTGPFPPNRQAIPLDPGSWVRAEDFRRFSRSRYGSGSVRFTLLVNEKGRVDECTVNASSGSRDFDAKACRSLQKRARFEPATDANGNVRSARYTSSVRLAID
ncbi:MAG: TonB family protein [Pseudomonadota bacterium]